MKKDTLEEIVREFGQKFALPDRISALTVDDGKQTPVDIWLRTTLTSYRNDVLEEVLAALPKKLLDKDGDDFATSIVNAGHEYFNIAIEEIAHLITTLKVDIIKR